MGTGSRFLDSERGAISSTDYRKVQFQILGLVSFTICELYFTIWLKKSLMPESWVFCTFPFSSIIVTKGRHSPFHGLCVEEEAKDWKSMQHEGINYGNWKKTACWVLSRAGQELVIVPCKFHFPMKWITLRQSLLGVQDWKTKQGWPRDRKGTFGILIGFLANYKVLMTFKGNPPPSVIYK